MSQQYHAEYINAWLELAAKGLPSERLACLFGETLRNLSVRASFALNKITLMAILKRVLYQSSEKYPVLSKLKVEPTGIPTEQFEHQFNQVDPDELSEAFRFLMNELLTILGNLTADILPTSPEEQKSSQCLIETRQSSERIEHLFEISKIFAGFETIEKTFPEIFMIIGNSFSFQTILLIEKKDGDCITSVWRNANTCEAHLINAFNYSRKSYEYLVCPLSHHETETYESVSTYVLPRYTLENNDNSENRGKFITMPLTLSSLQTFGVLQFESVTTLSEADLRFLTAVSNLLAITLDRFNKEQEAKRMRQVEFTERTNELVQAHEYVGELEIERDLREQFVSILTHDLRTPLTAAKIAAQLILKRPEKIDKNQILAGKIVGSIDRMDQMINDLLDANRIRSGKPLALTMSKCDLREVVTDTLKELSIAHGDRFILEADRGPIEGCWNCEGLRRALENLVCNAIKYGVSQTPITISIKKVDQNIQMIVHNFGNPILPEDQQFLFQPFHRTTTALNGNKKGWGLGLTLVRGVAEAHGGNVKVQSNEKDGTSFIVTIPMDSMPFQVLKTEVN